MNLQIFSHFFSQLFFILQLLFYSAIASFVIKYIASTWSLLTNNLTIDVMNMIALFLITIPVMLFAFVIWLKR